MPARQHFVRGVVCTLVGAALWGFSGACAQLLLSQYEIPATFITCVRMIGAGLTFLAVMAVRKRPVLAAMLKDRKTVVRLFVFGIGLYAGQVTYTMAIDYTNAGTATVLQCSGIVFVMLFTCFAARRPPKAREIVGLVLAVGGTYVIATHGDPTTLALPLVGLAWGLACGLAVAFGAVYPKKLLGQWGSLAVTGLSMLAGGIVAFFIAQPWTLSIELDAGGIAALAVMVFVGTFAAFYLYFRGVADIGPVRASLLSAVEPVSATFFSWVWLGTQFPLVDCIGFAMMIAMVFFVTSEKPDSKELDIVEVPRQRR